jgi:hypothetical protein
MSENQQDILVRAYVTLTALRKNIEQITIRYGVPEKYVSEFHTVLDSLEDIKIHVSEFRIPDSEVKFKILSRVVNHFGGGADNIQYSSEKYVDKPFILTKLDAILGYFEIITSEKPRKIGFTN